MILLSIGLLIFICIHLLPSFTNFRQELINRIGELPYKGLFSVISLLGFILIIIGKRNSEFIPIWNPPAWGFQITYIIMPLAFILVTAANVQGNIKRYIRHPMLWGVTLWSISHMFSSGDLASIIIFISFVLFAFFDMASANKRGASLSNIKFPVYWDIIVILVGIGAYAAVLIVHPSTSPILFID